MNNNFNYSLNKEDYNWTNALLWGNFIGHAKKIGEGSLGDRVVHALIAFVELIPIIGQIASIAEKLIVNSNNQEERVAPSSLADRDITLDDNSQPNSVNFPNPIDQSTPSTLPTVNETPSFISVGSRLENFKIIDGCRIYGEDEEQVEIALLGERVGHDTKLSPWKLHISANPENAGQILSAVEHVLLQHKPHFKFIKNEDLIEEYNTFVNQAFPERGLFKEGKFMTIYAKDEQEIFILAKDLDFALETALSNGHINVDLPKPAVCRTDRPIGKTGLLWARHDQAGSPITDVDYREGTHAAASVGNYNQTTYFPIDWAFDFEPQEMEENIRIKAEGVHTITHEDIFASEWGTVKWNSDSQRFENQQ